MMKENENKPTVITTSMGRWDYFTEQVLQQEKEIQELKEFSSNFKNQVPHKKSMRRMMGITIFINILLLFSFGVYFFQQISLHKQEEQTEYKEVVESLWEQEKVLLALHQNQRTNLNKLILRIIEERRMTYAILARLYATISSSRQRDELKMLLGKLHFEEISFQNFDFLEEKLVNMDFRNTDLRGAKLQRCDLSPFVIMSSMDGLYARFNLLCDLSEANLEGAFLDEANLSSVDMIKTNLRKARLPRVTLKYSQLQEANFEGCWLEGADLSYCDLTKTNFHEANLKYCLLKKVKGLVVSQLLSCESLEQIRGLSREEMQELKRRVPHLMTWWNENMQEDRHGYWKMPE